MSERELCAGQFLLAPGLRLHGGVGLARELLVAAQVVLARGELAGAEVLKAGRVWRLGEVVLKRYVPRRWRDRLRAPAALRAARAAKRLGPQVTPQALAALWQLSARGVGSSVLVTEHLTGIELAQALAQPDAAALAAFAPFLAELHARNVHHGDLHPWQFLWSRGRWHLLDLESLRHPWRAFARERLEREAWARLLYYARRFVSEHAAERLAELYPAYGRAHTPPFDTTCSGQWGRIEAEAASLLERRQPASEKPAAVAKKSLR